MIIKDITLYQRESGCSRIYVAFNYDQTEEHWAELVQGILKLSNNIYWSSYIYFDNQLSCKREFSKLNALNSQEIIGDIVAVGFNLYSSLNYLQTCFVSFSDEIQSIAGNETRIEEAMTEFNLYATGPINFFIELRRTPDNDYMTLYIKGEQAVDELKMLLDLGARLNNRLTLDKTPNDDLIYKESKVKFLRFLNKWRSYNLTDTLNEYLKGKGNRNSL